MILRLLGEIDACRFRLNASSHPFEIVILWDVFFNSLLSAGHSSSNKRSETNAANNSDRPSARTEEQEIISDPAVNSPIDASSSLDPFNCST